MLNICLKSKKNSNFTGRIKAFRVIERLERMNILDGLNTESVKTGMNLKKTTTGLLKRT